MLYVDIFNMLTELNHFTARFFDLIYNVGAAYAEIFNEQLEKRYQGDTDAQKDMSALNPSNGINISRLSRSCCCCIRSCSSWQF